MTADNDIAGWHLTVPATTIPAGDETILGWVVRIANEAEAKAEMSKLLGGLAHFRAKALSTRDAERYGLVNGGGRLEAATPRKPGESPSGLRS